MCRKTTFSMWAGARLGSLLEGAFYVAASVLAFTAVMAWMLVVGMVVVAWRALPWVVGAAALVIIALRVMEISESEYGLWQEYPHSGFTPDCPTWEGGER